MSMFFESSEVRPATSAKEALESLVRAWLEGRLRRVFAGLLDRDGDRILAYVETASSAEGPFEFFSLTSTAAGMTWPEARAFLRPFSLPAI